MEERTRVSLLLWCPICLWAACVVAGVVVLFHVPHDWQFLGAFLIGVAALLGVEVNLRQEPTKEDDKLEKREFPKLRCSDESSLLKREHMYAAAVQMVIHTDSISWNRLYNFLTAASIVMLAWATIFAAYLSHPDAKNDAKPLLVAISAVGLVLSVVWAPFGSRSRRLHTFYGDAAKRIEWGAVEKTPENGYPGPLSADRWQKYLTLEDCFSTRRLVVWVPLAFAAAFYFVLLKSVWL